MVAPKWGVIVGGGGKPMRPMSLLGVSARFVGDVILKGTVVVT